MDHRCRPPFYPPFYPPSRPPFYPPSRPPFYSPSRPPFHPTSPRLPFHRPCRPSCYPYCCPQFQPPCHPPYPSHSAPPFSCSQFPSCAHSGFSHHFNPHTRSVSTQTRLERPTTGTEISTQTGTETGSQITSRALSCSSIIVVSTDSINHDKTVFTFEHQYVLPRKSERQQKKIKSDNDERKT